jgi:1-acyl-sn-glycerol-3-phosphate acyltransferase
MLNVAERFKHIISQMLVNTTGNGLITKANVYQEGKPDNKHLLKQIVNDLMLPGSTLKGFENLVELHEKAKRGESCLILMEHYSNFDIPCFYELMEREGEKGKTIAQKIVSVAGSKLSETNRVVRSFAEIFTRVVIIPKSASQNLKDPQELKAISEKRKHINMAALKTLFRLRKSGRIILVFPAGTRYRPWEPDSKRGLKDIDSYLKSYDHMVLITINGNVLIPQKKSMTEDLVTHDVMYYTVSRVHNCRQFRKEARETAPEGSDKRQFAVDRVMAELTRLHEQADKIHRTLKEQLKGQTDS